MKKVLFYFTCVLPLIAITACGTGSTVSSDFGEWQKSGYTMEAYSVGEYESMTPEEQKLADTFVSKCSVTNDLLQFPLADSIISVAESDNKSLRVEYDALQLDANEPEFHNFLMKHFATVLETGGATMTSLKCTDSLDTSPMLTEINKLFEYEYTFTSNNGLDFNLTEIPAGNSFVDEQGNVRVLISDVQICSEEDAILKINELSPANDFNSSDSVYLLQYKVTNLSAESARVSNKFELFDGASLFTCKSDVLGLKQVAELSAGESAILSVCLVGPNTADVCWINAAGHSYKLINVP